MTSFERSGVGFSTDPAGWELSNTLVRVTPEVGGGGLIVEAFTGTSWHAKLWELSTSGTVLPLASGIVVLRNDFHEVSARLLYTTALYGRYTVDMTLRRGSRFVELYIQGQTASTIKVALALTTPCTPGTGYISSNLNDADGNRPIAGSARSYTTDNLRCGISKAATTTLDAFLGVVAGGSSAVAGDQAADLVKQYLGTPGELITTIRR